MAARNNDGAARSGGGGRRRFPGLRNRRLSVAVFFVVFGAAGILSTTVASLAANPYHAMAYFLVFMIGVLQLVLSIAAPDLP